MNVKEEYLFGVLDSITKTAREKGKTFDVQDLVRELEDIKDFCSEYADENERYDLNRIGYTLSDRANNNNPYSNDSLDTISYYDFRDILVKIMEKELGEGIVYTRATDLNKDAVLTMVLNKEAGTVSMYFGDTIDMYDLYQKEALSCYRNFSQAYVRDTFAKAEDESFIKNNVYDAPKSTMLFYAKEGIMDEIYACSATEQKDAVYDYVDFGIVQVGRVYASLSYKPDRTPTGRPCAEIRAEVTSPDLLTRPYTAYVFEIRSGYNDKISLDSICREVYEGMLSAVRLTMIEKEPAISLRDSLVYPTLEAKLEETNYYRGIMKKEPYVRQNLENDIVFLPKWAVESAPAKKKEKPARSR